MTEKLALGSFKTPEEKQRHKDALKASRGRKPSPSAAQALEDALSQDVRARSLQNGHGVAKHEAAVMHDGRSGPSHAPIKAPSPLDRFRGRVLRGDAIKTIPKPAPLVDGYLNLDSTAVVYGPSSAGKTFVVTGLALSVSTSSWWFGREVAKGPVLYIAAESPSVLGDRVGAWQEHENVPLNGVDWYPFPVSLLDSTDGATVAAYAKEIGARLVIFDTLARCMVGGDENSGRDMGLVVSALDTIREASGACVLAVHHTGKDTERGSRGHSSLRAAVDTELEVRGGDGTVSVITRKQRAGAEAEPLNLRLVAVGSSMALTRWRPGLDGGALPAKTVEALDALAAIEVDGGVSSTVWRTSCDMPERTFYRARKTLLDAGLVHNFGTETVPKYATTATATTTANDCHGSSDNYCQPLPPPYGVAVGSVTTNGSPQPPKEGTPDD